MQWSKGSRCDALSPLLGLLDIGFVCDMVVMVYVKLL